MDAGEAKELDAEMDVHFRSLITCLSICILDGVGWRLSKMQEGFSK